MAARRRHAAQPGVTATRPAQWHRVTAQPGVTAKRSNRRLLGQAGRGIHLAVHDHRRLAQRRAELLKQQRRARMSPATTMNSACYRAAAAVTAAASSLAFSAQASSAERWYRAWDQPPTEVLCTGHP
jgi:hypothetical protein